MLAGVGPFVHRAEVAAFSAELRRIGGAPFGEEEVLRVAYAYEQATSWHSRQPMLGDAAPPKLSINSIPSEAPDIDQRTVALVDAMARRARL